MKTLLILLAIATAPLAAYAEPAPGAPLTQADIDAWNKKAAAFRAAEQAALAQEKAARAAEAAARRERQSNDKFIELMLMSRDPDAWAIWKMSRER